MSAEEIDSLDQSFIYEEDIFGSTRQVKRRDCASKHMTGPAEFSEVHTLIGQHWRKTEH